MLRTLNAAIPVALLLSALALSACATKPAVIPVAAPAPVEVAAESPPATEPVPEPAPTEMAAVDQPVVVAEPVPKKVIRKARKKIAQNPMPKAAPPAPVAAPAPVVQEVAPAVVPPEPAAPVTVATTEQETTNEDSAGNFWLWLISLSIAAAGIAAWWWKSREN